MRILLVCNEYPPLPHGGIGTFVQSYARALSLRGHNVFVVGISSHPSVWDDGDVRVRTILSSRLRYVGNLFSRIRLRRFLTEMVQRENIDIIETPDYMGFLPFGVPGCPVIVRLHLSDTAICLAAKQKPGPAIRFYERETLRYNANWIGVSDYIMKLTKETFSISPQQSAIVYNPLPATPTVATAPSGLPANFVLFASAVTRRKGAIVLAQAMRDLLAHRPELHLVYVGQVFNEGPKPVSDIALDLFPPSLKERVHFLGRLERDQVLACMANARVFAFPSTLEAFGLVALEAMSKGVPIVCTNFPPGPELVQDGVNGLLADPRIAKDFQEKILRLLDDPELAKRLSTNALKDLGQRFSMSQCIDLSLKFYEQCIRSGVKQ